MKKTLLLTDGDELIYKAGFASQSVEYHIVDLHGNVVLKAPNKTTAFELLGNHEDETLELIKVINPKGEDAARHALYAVMNTILADNDPTDYRLYMTGDGNFRYDIATLLPYKGNRQPDGRPYYYDFIRHLLHEEYWAITVDGMEADDALSITQWHHVRNDTNWTTIIGSQDKDLKMVPGKHYNPSTRESYELTWQEARFNFYCQLLAGDPVDNIPGIYRIGIPTAQKMLRSKMNKSNAELYDVVFKAYIKAQEDPVKREKMPGAKWGEDRIKEVGRLLWMLQEKYQLWNPGEDYYAGLG